MKYLLANWKMYTTVTEALMLFGAIQKGLQERSARPGSLPLSIVCPPHVSLFAIRPLADLRLLRLGAQNCHWEAEGPYTGETSPKMLTGLVDYVLVGHSERRTAGETDEQIARKVAAIAGAGLTPILFVGEDDPGDAAAVESERRLMQGLSLLDLQQHQLLVVYEPAWCVGGDRPAEADHVAQVVERLKSRLVQNGAQNPEIIYGGTVTEQNVDHFARLEVLDGVGATRASLNAQQFLQMIDRVTRTAPPADGAEPTPR